jgi:putative redox protein
MTEVKVKWVENRQFVGLDSTQHSLVMSAASEGTGLKPSDLLLLGLGGCTGIDVVGILEKQRQNVTGLEIHVSSKQDSEPPWTFREIHIEYVLHGHGLSEKAVARAIELSEEKYCSVGATLRGSVHITNSHKIIEDAIPEPA